LAEKPSFRSALKRRRCLIPADGFYEWQKPAARGGAKTPMHVRLTSGAPFAFAGLWEVWHAPDGSEIASCTIITTTPNELMAPIHNRMPVILAPDAYDPWLDPAERSSKELAALLTPYPAAEMTANPVGATVNNPRNDSPDCILAVKNA
jgi:putative SOS response-associated peptidase YedK